MKDCIFQLEMCFLSIKISDKLVALEMENIESVEKGQIDKVTNHCTEAMEINTWKRRERWYTHLDKRMPFEIADLSF